MSGSPKYSMVRNTQARRRQLEQERHERERKRREEQARRATAALVKARAAADRNLAALTDRCAELAAQPAVTDADRAPVDRALVLARRSLRHAATASELAAAVHKLNDVERLRVSVSAEVLRRGRRDAVRTLAWLHRVLDEINPADRARFDPATADQIDAAIRAAAAAMNRGDLGTFESEAAALLTAVREHHIKVNERAARHAERLRAAQALAEEIAARLAGLVGDAETSDVHLEDLDVAGEVLDQVRADLNAEKLDQAIHLAELLMSRLDDLERDLDTAIERLTARREMLGSIVDRLPALGFAVDPGSLTYSADGSIGVQARRLSGESLSVVVQQEADEQRVNYLGETADGQRMVEGRACSTLVALADDLNSSMHADGFEPGPVTWDNASDWRPPRLRRRTLPQDGGLVRRRRGETP